jgi:glucan phosphoethanolaminetransferase (alkaline phosphatase superfamily)
VIISRTLARKRIAAGVRPSFKAAWLPVAADVLIIALLLAALWNPALTFIYLMQLSLFWLVLFLMAVIYAPLQIVIIVSTIWAVRSRWEDKEQSGG